MLQQVQSLPDSQVAVAQAAEQMRMYPEVLGE
jgi:hypothetical protein